MKAEYKDMDWIQNTRYRFLFFVGGGAIVHGNNL